MRFLGLKGESMSFEISFQTVFEGNESKGIFLCIIISLSITLIIKINHITY